MSRQTFLNGDADVAKRGKQHLKFTAERMQMYSDNYEIYKEGNEDYPPFYEYDLCFDFVESDGDYNDGAPYFRYQMSYGGPSDEFRFYEPDMIEYVFLDWFVGVGFDVTDEPWAQWLRDNLKERGMLDFNAKREEHVL